MKHTTNLLMVVLTGIGLVSCSRCNPSSTTLIPSSGILRVTATSMMVADLVKRIGGEYVSVVGLMGPGVDPHLYKATSSDLAKLKQADIVFYSGLMLEGKLQEILDQYQKTKIYVYAITSDIPESKLIRVTGENVYDPHVWFDVSLWNLCVDPVVRGLGAADPRHAVYYQKQGEIVRKQLEVLHAWVVQALQKIPKTDRILVTSHDAFGYFGRQYGFQVVGLQGISTVTQAGLSDVAKLVDYIKQYRVKAIFVESSISPKALERISRDAKVAIAGELFSDAMGTPGDIENGYDKGTYEGMVRHNVNTIVRGLMSHAL